MKSLNMSKIRW